MIRGDFRYIFFDADDTLWENEEFFRTAESRFAERLSAFADVRTTVDLITQKQEENIRLFGYGSKTFMMSMLDAAAEVCGEHFDGRLYLDAKQIITDLAYHEFRLIDGVEEVLQVLSRKYVLAVATKGDLTEQMYKYKVSGISGYFHHIEVMRDKSCSDYLAMARKLNVSPTDVLMVGNAIKSDIAPVIEIGGTAIYVPYKVTWQHELMEMPVSDRVFEIKCIKDLPNLLL